MTEPLRSTFDEELEAIKSGILIMSNMVVETIPKGTEALLEGNLTTAQEIIEADDELDALSVSCLLYTSPSPRDQRGSRMPSSA